MAELGYNMLSTAQYIPVVVVGTISTSLSVVGSTSIMFMSYRQRVKVLHRLLFLLSLADFTSSFSGLVMPYAIPSFLGLPGAVGNHATCTAVGFFLMLGTMFGATQNGYVGLYFFLVVVRGWRESDFNRRRNWEIVIELFTFLWCFVLVLIPAFSQAINPYSLINNVCIVAAFPWNCGDEEGQLPCTRASPAEIGRTQPAHVALISAFTLMGLICTLWVVYHVHRIRRQSASYQFRNSSNPASSSVTMTNRSGSHRNSNNTPDPVLQQVCTQAVLYFLVYLNTLFWPFMRTIIWLTPEEIQERKTDPSWYAIHILYWMLHPLAGFFNFFVYTRTKVQDLRGTNPDRSLFSIYKQVIFDIPGTGHRVTSTRHNSCETTKSHRIMPAQPSSPTTTAAIHNNNNHNDGTNQQRSFCSFAGEEEELREMGDNENEYGDNSAMTESK